MAGPWARMTIAASPPTSSRHRALPRFGVLFLHGVGCETLARTPRLHAALDELNLACVCPHGQRSWWADRICAEFDSGGHARAIPARTGARLLPDAGAWPAGHRPAGHQHGRPGGAAAGVQASADSFPSWPASPRPSTITSSTARARRSTRCTTARSSAARTPPCCTSTRATIRRTSSSASTPTTRWYRGNDRLHEKLNALGVPHDRRPDDAGRRALLGILQRHGRAAVRFLYARAWSRRAGGCCESD